MVNRICTAIAPPMLHSSGGAYDTSVRGVGPARPASAPVSELTYRYREHR
jgi:hypothetical protein